MDMRLRWLPRPEGALAQVMPRSHVFGAPVPHPQVQEAHQLRSLLHHDDAKHLPALEVFVLMFLMVYRSEARPEVEGMEFKMNEDGGEGTACWVRRAVADPLSRHSARMLQPRSTRYPT
ncbi:unnamed protein product [Urochloa humidicola]